MRTTVTALLLLGLALVATGGEARPGDGVSARQLLTHPEPPSCKDSKCDEALKYGCEWLPKDLKCDDGGKHKVYVKNCFKDKVGYISIYAGGKCTKYSSWGGDTIAKLELKCGEEITIYGWGKHLKGDGSTACSEDASRQAGNYCKTCKFIAKFKCPYAHHPGELCRKADGDCDVPEYLDSYCVCPYDGFQNSSYVCRESSGPCDDGAKCTGTDAKCPHSGYKDDKTICRNSTGPCDVAEYCYHGHCPADEKVPAGKLCREKYGECDVADYCDGHSADCYDKKAMEGTVCRKAKGPCDAEEKCDGTSQDCPKDYCIDYRYTDRTELTKEYPYCPAQLV